MKYRQFKKQIIKESLIIPNVNDKLKHTVLSKSKENELRTLSKYKDNSRRKKLFMQRRWSLTMVIFLTIVAAFIYLGNKSQIKDSLEISEDYSFPSQIITENECNDDLRIGFNNLNQAFQGIKIQSQTIYQTSTMKNADQENNTFYWLDGYYLKSSNLNNDLNNEIVYNDILRTDNILSDTIYIKNHIFVIYQNHLKVYQKNNFTLIASNTFSSNIIDTKITFNYLYIFLGDRLITYNLTNLSWSQIDITNWQSYYLDDEYLLLISNKKYDSYYSLSNIKTIGYYQTISYYQISQGLPNFISSFNVNDKVFGKSLYVFNDILYLAYNIGMKTNECYLQCYDLINRQKLADISLMNNEQVIQVNSVVFENNKVFYSVVYPNNCLISYDLKELNHVTFSLTVNNSRVYFHHDSIIEINYNLEKTNFYIYQNNQKIFSEQVTKINEIIYYDLTVNCFAFIFDDEIIIYQTDKKMEKNIFSAHDLISVLAIDQKIILIYKNQTIINEI